MTAVSGTALKPSHFHASDPLSATNRSILVDIQSLRDEYLRAGGEDVNILKQIRELEMEALNVVQLGGGISPVIRQQQIQQHRSPAIKERHKKLQQILEEQNAQNAPAAEANSSLVSDLTLSQPATRTTKPALLNISIPTQSSTINSFSIMSPTSNQNGLSPVFQGPGISAGGLQTTFPNFQSSPFSPTSMQSGSLDNNNPLPSPNMTMVGLPQRLLASTEDGDTGGGDTGSVYNLSDHQVEMPRYHTERGFLLYWYVQLFFDAYPKTPLPSLCPSLRPTNFLNNQGFYNRTSRLGFGTRTNIRHLRRP
jgi:hypothetical protein